MVIYNNEIETEGKKINQGGKIEVQHTHKIHIKSGTY